MKKVVEDSVLPTLGQGAVQGVARRWPFFVLILTVMALLGGSPWLYTLLVPRMYDFQLFSSLQLFGNRAYVNTTPADLIYNPFGPDFALERAEEMLKCMRSSPPSTPLPSRDPGLPAKECPSYFQFIHKDLEPWKETGITVEMVEAAKRTGIFRIVILDSKLYMERYDSCFQTRAVFTVFGLLLFLEKFKGQVPDVEFVFTCGDVPRIPKRLGVAAVNFAYDSNHEHYDIPFPDWTFWGWSELLISSWDEKREAIVKGSQRMDWEEKAPTAYWTGNPWVGAHHRQELLKCHNQRMTEIRSQNWGEEIAKKKEHSKLEDQCTHKHMIYTEGNGWSVSLKYILACGAPTLAISPFQYDFYSRGLRQWVHYIPVRPAVLNAPQMCEAIDQGVEWAVANQTVAIEIGIAAQHFMRNELSVENVYNYMFHLLREYAQLLKFQPVQGAAHLVTIDHVLCLVQPGVERDTLQQTLKVTPTNSVPCQMSESSVTNFEDPDWEVILPAP
ncbi:unnamed protein product [Calypogeia fissa]